MEMPRFSRVSRTIAATAALLLLLSSPAVAEEGSSERPDQLWIENSTSGAELEAPNSPYPELVEKVGAAVVNINVQYDDHPIPPHVRRMVDVTDAEHLPVGSGFIIHPDGFVVTNYHVIEGADSVTIALDDGTELRAQVIGADEQADVALLSVESDHELQAVPIGDSNSLRVGDYVVAIGNPLGLSHTVTAGIVSSLDRRNLNIEGTESPVNFIQTDAPITLGNSGGPLLNLSGEVIGVTTAYNPHVQHLGFAIPINLVKVLLPQLYERGYVLRSWLGIRVQPLTPALARSYGIEGRRGALVTEVLEDSPAERAGFEPEDVIVRFGDDLIEVSDELTLLVSLSPADTPISVEVLRDGQAVELEVELETVPDQRPPELPGDDPGPVSEAEGAPGGVQVEAMTESLSRRLRAPAGSGVVVTSMTRNSPARNAGLRARDVILEVGSTTVDSEVEFQQAFDNFSAGDVVRLKVLRNGRAVFVAFEQ